MQLINGPIRFMLALFSAQQQHKSMHSLSRSKWTEPQDSIKNILKKRCVKRFVHKKLLFVITISLIMLNTTMFLKKRMTQQSQSMVDIKEPTVRNGDSITLAYSRLQDVKTPRRPRPPMPQRHFKDKDKHIERKAFKNVKEYVKGNEDSATVDIFQLPIAKGPLRDWHDYEAMKKDKQRVGLGEHGEPAFIKDDTLKERQHLLSLQYGYNALLSDYISVNRSLPDVRHPGCQTKQYLPKLPAVSVIITCFNEHFSVLLRTIHSIKNRTPPELLKEIILVDDFSDREFMHKQLKDYIDEHFGDLVLILHLTVRSGLIRARLAGAKRAICEVLVFFDSHIEANVNWLPPLIEPIVLNPKIATCPVINTIHDANFMYEDIPTEGTRGAFDWEMYYYSLPILPEDAVDKTKPSKNPIMMGGLFAIGRDFFWELGGYDEELNIWGAEQYELSFKIWMCGGMMFDVPCSRVAHIIRGPMDPKSNPGKYKFANRNHKRVAEVWMDEFKNYLYEHNPGIYEAVDAGDLTIPKAVRKRLHCKSFKWFMEVVAPDALKAFPPVEPPDYASGTIQSVPYPDYCLDTMNNGSNRPVGLFSCAENHTFPQRNQLWSLSGHHDLRLFRKIECLDVHDTHGNATVWLWDCHHLGGNQFWYYDREHQWLVHGRNGGKCMEAWVDGDNSGVYTNDCDATNERMKWRFGYVDDIRLDHFYSDLLSKNST